MIVPAFWAEARVQSRVDGHQVTVRRFGWSDVDALHAQAHADERAAAALARIAGGEPLVRRERKVPYNGADGMPIREEIVERHGATIVTRNAYGARCLNTPDALFADVDFASTPGRERPGLEIASTLMVVAGIALAFLVSQGLGLVVVATGVFLVRLVRLVEAFVSKLRGSEEVRAYRRFGAFAQRHPDWSLRVYRTPAGLRALATHRPFVPDEPAVREFFDAVGVDPLYAAMCRHQRCFRARLTAKPWRIGIGDHLKPRPGVWPVEEAQRPRREAWLERYEAAAKDFAACRFVGALGAGAVHEAVADVLRLHDEACRATTELPLA